MPKQTIMGDQNQARSGYSGTAYPDRRASRLNRMAVKLRTKTRELVATFKRRTSKADIEAEAKAIQDSGLFDPDFYLAFYPEYKRECQDPVEHYCRFGWKSGKNPSDEFDTDFYLETNDDIRESGMNPFLHYVNAGQRELRAPRLDLKTYHEHDIWFGDIPDDLTFIAFYQTPDWQRFRLGRKVSVSYAEPPLPLEPLGYYAITDPGVIRLQADLARRHGVACFCFDLAAEEPNPGDALSLFLNDDSIDLQLCVQIVLQDTSAVSALKARLVEAIGDPRYLRTQDAPVVLVRDPSPESASLEALKQLQKELLDLGLSVAWIGRSGDHGGLTAAHQSLYQALLDQPSEPVPGETGVFTPVTKKGVRLVPYRVIVAQGLVRARALSSQGLKTFHCLTLGRHTDTINEQQPLVYTRFNLRSFREWLDQAIDSTRASHPEGERLVFLDSWNDWNSGNGLEPDRQFGYGKLNELSRAIKGLPCGFVMPKVSVIVPNYNHSEFLVQRLDSIYSQTHTNIEVILLDDNSQDSSRDILESYARRYPEITRCIFNETNSGGAFRQWAKGIKEAQGKLVWIAESDDYCDSDLLSKLVKAFEDETVVLAYAKSVFVDREGTPLAAGFRYQVLDLPCGNRWLESFVETAHNEVNLSLGIKNTIPNASGALFRRPVSMDLLDDPQWLQMRVVGDWVFYLHVIRGGRIAFCNTTNNYFRRYSGSTAESGYMQEYFYREAGLAAATVARLYRVSNSVHDSSRAYFQKLYRHHLKGTDEQFDAWYGADQTAQQAASRTPNIVVSTVGFYPGGAEILPIRFANELKRRGHSVLLLSAGLHVREQGVREMLRNDVPIVETSDLDETKQALLDFGIEALNSHQWQVQRYPYLRPDIFATIGCHAASLHGMIEHGNDFGVTREELLAADKGVSSWIYTADKNLGPFVDLDVLEHSQARFVKLPNGMEPPEIQPVRRADLGIPDDAFVLCCVSRAIPEKGWSEAIEVVEMARSLSGRDIRLIFVGNGKVYEEYCRNGKPDYVYLAGFNDNSVGHYAASDMGIMLTRFKSESFPLTIVDCLFAGKPYLATDVGEIRNILTSPEGIAGDVIPLDDWQIPIELCAQSLLRFVMDREHYLEATDRAIKTSKRYRIDEVIDQYLEVFAEDLRRHRRLG